MSAKEAECDSEDHNKEFQQQIDTYIAWVNSQLKKRAGTKPVTDLKKDFCDGIVLSTLVEIISGENLEGIKKPAKKMEEKQHNINSVLKFLNGKDIRMHHITDRDVTDGNVRSLMRLILTLAAHFKPASVGSKKSVSAAAANATVALSDMHKRVTSSGGYRPRWKSSTPSYQSRKYVQISPSPRTGPNRSDLAHVGSPAEDDSFVLNKLPSSSEIFSSPSLPERSKSKHSDTSFSSTPIQNLSSINNEIILSSGTIDSEQLTEYYDDLECELSGTRELISVLQNLLLNGEYPGQNEKQDGEEACLPLETSTTDEANLILTSQLDLCQHENSRLKAELADMRQECRSTSANQSALHSRTQLQDKELLSLKQQVLKLNLANEKLNKEKQYVLAQVEESKRENQALSSDLSEKNMMIKGMKDEIGRMSTQLKRIRDDSKHKLNSVQQLEMQVKELDHQLRIVQRYKESSGLKPSGNEMAVISESLNSLRLHLPPHDSRQHILDTLEQAVMSLTESRQQPGRPVHHKTEYTRHPVSHSPRNRRKTSSTTSKTPSTTVIYFTERNRTPSRVTIPKRIGSITLRDFKGVIHSTERYKYNFKALDPEFGTVKKEVFHDNEIVPGWEGKIVAWLEKDISVDNNHV